jgi:hypothetical protein
MGQYTYSFDGDIERLGVGYRPLVWHGVLFLPDEVRRAIPVEAFPRPRVKGEIEGVALEGEWQLTGKGQQYFIVPALVRKKAGVGVGSRVTFHFNVDLSGPVELPPALEKALAKNKKAKEAWDELPIGRRGNFAQIVAQAKSEAARKNRVADVLARLLT